jgi:AcrR family transcriptional regulator
MAPDDRRDQILRVAASLFAREGYDAASVQRIATEAGVTRALVYHYFPGKASLLEAVLGREADKLLKATALDPELPARDNLQRALGAYLDHFNVRGSSLCDLHTPTSQAITPMVQKLTRSTHTAQVERILHAANLERTPKMRLAIRAWLAFVVEATREAANLPEVSRHDVIEVCIGAFQGITGVIAQPEDTEDTPMFSSRKNDERR